MAQEEVQSRERVFYGWWVVTAASVGLFVGFGPVITFTFGIFFNAMSEELGWSRGEFSLAFSLSLLMLACFSPLVGRLVDRFGARAVIVPSTVLFGLAFMSLGALSSHIWHAYAVFLFMGAVGGGTAPVPYSGVVSRWFDRRRGLALGLMMAGTGLGTFVMPALASALIGYAGWRGAYLAIGLFVIAVAVPVVSLLLVDAPETVGQRPDGDAGGPAAHGPSRDGDAGLSARDALSSGGFWIMFAAFFLVSASVHGSLIHMVPMLTDRGLSAQAAAFATSLLGGALLIGRVGTGYLLDRLFAPYVAACLFFGAALGLLFLWSGATGGLAFAGAFLMGLGMGAEVDIIAFLVSRYFGLRSFGEIYGYAFGSYMLGGVAGPFAMGVGFDAAGSYDAVLGAFLVATCAAVVLIARLGPYQTDAVGRAEGAPAAGHPAGR